MWQSLRYPENRAVLAWLGPGLAAVAAGAWVVFVSLVPPGGGAGDGITTTGAAPRVPLEYDAPADNRVSIGRGRAVSGHGADAWTGEGEEVDPAPTPRTRGLRALPNPAPPVTAAAGPPEPDPDSAPSGFDRLLGELVTGAVAFNAPATMRLHELSGIHAVLGVGVPTDRLKDLVDEPGPVDSAVLRVSTVMRATLTGAGFGITPIQPQTQVVSWTEPTEWRWQVEAQKPGRQYLYLTFDVLLSLEDTERPRLLATLRRAITVEVTWGQRFASSLGALKDVHWLWTAIIVPLALAVYAWSRKHRAA